MKRFRLKAGARLAGALAVSTAVMTLGNLAISRPVGADPGFLSSYIGVGSDTLQDLFNAYSGAEPYPNVQTAQAVKDYTPLRTSLATKNKQISSFDAVDAVTGTPGCITTKLGGATFDRPNGSSDGVAALSHAQDGTGWQKAGTCAASPGNVSGQIDFSRSSRDHNAVAGTNLTFIPFARDAVSFAFFDHNTGNLALLTKTQLTSLYSSGTGTITVGTDTVKACITQQGSGTTKFWETAIGVTDAQAQAASAASGCSANPSTLEENGGNSFFTFANAQPAGTDVVVDFSVGSWISQANGTALDRSANARAGFVDLGAIDPGTGTLGKPYTGTPGTEAPSTTFYTDTTFGRNLFVVVPTSKLAGLHSDPGLVSLFSGGTSAICSSAAQTTAHSFGFDSLTGAEGTCGDTSAARQAGLYS
jgi:hypothetical protein